jgi:hypothetical protein
MKLYGFARIGRQFEIGVRFGDGHGLALLLGVLAGVACALFLLSAG